MGQMNTPFTDRVMQSPSPEGDFRGTRGGMDLPGGIKETAGGELPTQPTIDSFTGDSPLGPRDISSYMANQVWQGSKAQNG